MVLSTYTFISQSSDFLVDIDRYRLTSISSRTRTQGKGNFLHKIDQCLFVVKKKEIRCLCTH